MLNSAEHEKDLITSGSGHIQSYFTSLPQNKKERTTQKQKAYLAAFQVTIMPETIDKRR